MKRKSLSGLVFVLSVCVAESTGSARVEESLDLEKEARRLVNGALQTGMNALGKAINGRIDTAIKDMFRSDDEEPAVSYPVLPSSASAVGNNEMISGLTSNQAAIISLLRQQQSSQELTNEMLLFLIAQQQQRQGGVDSADFSTSNVSEIEVSCEGTDGFGGDLDQDL